MVISFIDKNKLKAHILSELTQEEIFAYYLSCTVADVVRCTGNTSSDRVLNTIRQENHPSLSFLYRGKTLRCRDWGNDYYSGDCFHIAGKKLGLDCNNNKQFTAILWHIINNKEYIKDGYITTLNANDTYTNGMPRPSDFSRSVNTLKVDALDLDRGAINLYYKYGLRYDTLKRGKVFLVERATFNDTVIYRQSKNDICIGYYLGVEPNSNKELWQLYFPTRPHKMRFRHNNIYPIQYPHELKKASVLVITKSRKDCLLLRQIISDLGFADKIMVTSFSSESIVITPEFDTLFKKMYNSIFTLCDFDKAGRKCAFNHKQLYGYTPLFLTNGRFKTHNYFDNGKGKDITDYTSSHSIVASNRLIKDTIEIYKHLI